MSDDCIMTGLSEDQARINLMTYLVASFAAAPPDLVGVEVIYPNMKPPALESRTVPFIMLTLNSVFNDSTGIGEDSYRTIKTLDISLWIKEYTGIKLSSKFIDFVKGLGIKTVAHIAYGVPSPAKVQRYKGWELHTVLLPLQF